MIKQEIHKVFKLLSVAPDLGENIINMIMFPIQGCTNSYSVAFRTWNGKICVFSEKDQNGRRIQRNLKIVPLPQITLQSSVEHIYSTDYAFAAKFANGRVVT